MDESVLIKHAPGKPKAKSGSREVWVSRKSRKEAIIKYCTSILEKGEPCTIHAMGAAISYAVDIALEIEQRWKGLVSSLVTTDTVNLMDELQPVDEDEDCTMSVRLNSSIKIILTAKLNK